MREPETLPFVQDGPEDGKYLVVLKFKDGREINSVVLRKTELKMAITSGYDFYKADEVTVRQILAPNDGGCWFCNMYTQEEDRPYLFDSEFDTWVHEDCLKKELKENPDNPEARIMSYLLEGENEHS